VMSNMPLKQIRKKQKRSKIIKSKVDVDVPSRWWEKAI